MNTSKYFKFFSKRTKSLFRLDPARDWFVLLVLSLLLLSVIIVWNAWAFDTVAGGGVIDTPSSNAAPLFSQSSLDTIHTIFANRAIEDAKYTSSSYHFTDPSQ